MSSPEDSFGSREWSAPVDKTEDTLTHRPVTPEEASQRSAARMQEVAVDMKRRAIALGLDENASFEKIYRAEDKHVRMKLAQELGLITEQEAAKMAKGTYNVSWRELYAEVLGLHYFSTARESDIDALIHRSLTTRDRFADPKKR